MCDAQRIWTMSTRDTEATHSQGHPPCRYLAELITMAETVRPRFQLRVAHTLAKHTLTSAEVLVGPLKRAGRIAQKAADKYKGCYANVLDLVRLTVVCTALPELTKAFEAIASMRGTRLIRAKNRLHGAFDATQSAGYRYAAQVACIVTRSVCHASTAVSFDLFMTRIN